MTSSRFATCVHTIGIGRNEIIRIWTDSYSPVTRFGGTFEISILFTVSFMLCETRNNSLVTKSNRDVT